MLTQEVLQYIHTMERMPELLWSGGFPCHGNGVCGRALGVVLCEALLTPSGRARSGGCMLKAVLSSYQWNSCPETCPGAETRAVCSPFGANIVRRLPLPAAGPCWAQRPNRGLHSPAQNMHAQPWTRGGAHHLPGIVMPPSNSTSCAHWCFWPESRGSCYMWGFGWDETEVPGLHLAGPQRDPCLLTPTRTPFCI